MAELRRGDEFAGCRIAGVVGRGGMGVVYRAIDPELGREVALKLIDVTGDDEALRRRFVREARLAAAIEHPHVVPVYSAGEEAGRLYLVMRYVRGTDLAALLRRSGRLEPRRAVALTAQIAGALDAIHRAGLVHRDVKPANILVGAGDHAYLTDFGITRADGESTRITDSGGWIGTVDFMAPEQLRGEPAVARSDVYALGCVLHTALTGVPPLHRGTVVATMQAQLNEPPPAPSRTAGVPAALDAVLARALAKAAADRFPTATALAAAATAALGDAGGIAAGGPAGDPVAGVATAVTTDASRAPTVVAAAAQPAAAATRILPRPQPAGGDGLPAAPRRPRAPSPPLPRGRPRRLLLPVAALVVLAPAAIFALARSRSPATPRGPLTAAEVERTAAAFARAYSHEDAPAIARLLTADARRVAPGAQQTGRDAVGAEYARQFAAMAIGRYTLGRLTVRAGDVGRAEGDYTVTRAGSAPLTGTVTFLVVRRGGRPRIALLATEPRS